MGLMENRLLFSTKLAVNVCVLSLINKSALLVPDAHVCASLCGRRRRRRRTESRLPPTDFV